MPLLHSCWLPALMLAALPAFSQVPAQRQNDAIRAATSLNRGFDCPANVKQMVDKATKEHSLPERIAMSSRVQSNTSLDMAILAMKRAGMTENPAYVEALAKQLGMLPEERRQALATGTGGRMKTPDFMSRVSAEIEIRNLAPGMCGEECETDIAWSVVGSLGIWRFVCFYCLDDFLSVVSSGRNHWVDVRIVRWMRQPGAKTVATFPAREASRFANQFGITAARPGEPKETLPYELVERSDPAVKAICAASLRSASNPRALSAVQRALCDGETPAVGEAAISKMRVVLTPQATSCGPAKSYVACGKPDNSVELTLDGTRYSFLDAFGKGMVSIGPADVPELHGQFVMLHEVGHWFGLPHLMYKPDEIPDFMQEIYQERPCFTSLSLSLINNMLDADYEKRFSMGGGLKRLGVAGTK